MGQCIYKPIIRECQLDASLLAVLLWGVCASGGRILIICTDNMNVSHLPNADKPHDGCASRLLRKVLSWCVTEGVEITPRYVRSGHNITADGLTRWSEEEFEEWKHINQMARSSLHAIWSKCPSEWSEPRPVRPRETFMMVGHMMNLYKGRDTRVAEWRPEMYSTTRILNEWAIPPSYLEIMGPLAFAYLPDTVTQYTDVNARFNRRRWVG